MTNLMKPKDALGALVKEWEIEGKNDPMGTPSRNGYNLGLRKCAEKLKKALQEEREGINKAMHLIDHVINDEESGGEGWGPDATMVKYLKDAMDILEKYLPKETK